MDQKMKVYFFCFGCGRLCFIKVVVNGVRPDIQLRPCEWCKEEKMVAL